MSKDSPVLDHDASVLAPPASTDGTAGRDNIREPTSTRAFLRTWAAAFLPLALFSTMWSLVTPPAGGPDEPAHAIKAAAVVEGELIGRPDPVLGGGSTFVEVSTRWERLDAMPGCFAFYSTVSADCSGSLDGPTADKAIRTRAGISPPFFHGMVGAPMRFSPTIEAFYLSRLIGSLVAAALLAMALSLAAAARSWFLVGAVLVSWTPTAAFLSGVINPSSLEISAGTLVWVSGLLLARPDGVPTWLRRRLAWFLVAGAVPFALSRQVSPILLTGIVATLLIATQRSRLRSLAADRRIWLPAGLVAAATLGAVVWMLTHPLAPGGDQAAVEYGRRDMITVPLGRVGELYTQTVATFGWLDTRPPGLVLTGWTVAIGVLVVLGTTLGPRRLVVAAGALAVGTLTVYVGLEASMIREHGPLFQGRYLLPMAMGIVMLPARGIDEAEPAIRRRLLPALWIVLGITATAHLVSIWFGARRFAVGTEGPVLFLGRPGWHAGVPQAISLGLALVAVGGMVAWVRSMMRHDAWSIEPSRSPGPPSARGAA